MAKKIVVLGAGISGLATAWYLKKNGGSSVDVILIEKANRAGGWISTKFQDGFLFEEGPRGIRPRGAGKATLKLIQELGLESEVIPASAVAKKRYLYQAEKLRSVPFGLLWPILKGIAFEKRPKCLIQPNETIDSFFRSRFGHTVTDLVVGALVSGIYAGDSTRLSMESCFPSLYAMEKKHGSLWKAIWKRKKEEEEKDPFLKKMMQEPLLTFRDGMETLPKTLVQQLDVQILFNQTVQKLEKSPRSIQIYLQDQILECDQLYSSIPAYALAPLIEESSPEASLLLHSIPYASLDAIHLGFRSQVVNKKGFGYLVSTKNPEPILGCIWNSSAFPQLYASNVTCLTVMQKSAEGAICRQKVLTALKKHQSIDSQPDVYLETRVRNAIPQYMMGHEKKKERLRQLLPWICLVGSAYDGVGVNDCIAAAARLPFL